jgi:putative NADPH-quinone reductase
VDIIDVAQLDFPLLRTMQEYREGRLPEGIREAQETIRSAEHLLIVYPLWLGTLPALLKGFLEQTFREGFAVRFKPDGRGWTRLLKGKSARIVVTMGMPSLIYRVYFGAHGLKSLERSILAFAGIGPIRESLIGMVDGRTSESRGRWLIKMQTLGRAAR